jgi:hypothetical protein
MRGIAIYGGKLVWYYDHAPGETLDLDEVFERVLVDDQGEHYVFSSGKTGILLWETRLPAVQGFPLTFSVGGEQYVAVTTANGGGSPRNVPGLVATDVHSPETGNALYVFALGDKR